MKIPVTTPLDGVYGSVWVMKKGNDGNLRNSTKFIQIPIKRVVLSSVFANLSGNAVKLLVHLITQYWRNVLACIPLADRNCLRIDTGTRKQIGWQDSRTLAKAVDELLDAMLIDFIDGNRFIRHYSLKWLRGSKKGKARFIRLPLLIVDSYKFRNLSGNAIKLLLQRMALASDPEAFGSVENGYLDFSYLPYKKRGWKSPTTFNKAKQELLDCGYLVQTLPESRYTTDYAHAWITPIKYDVKYVKGQYAPARYAITWDGYDPSRLDNWMDGNWCLAGLALKTAQAKLDLSAMMPVSEFPFRKWMDDY